MARKKRQPIAARLRNTKGALLAVSLTLAGLLLMLLGNWIEKVELGAWTWLREVPLSDIGGTLLVAGLVGTIFDMALRRDQEEAVKEHFREIIKEQAPAMRDAVIDGFAIHQDDLRRVANPDLLDQIATNVMSLRLGDDQFASELYRDVRDQAIRAAERWHDVEVRIRLSTAVERSTRGTPLFDVTVEWEYTTVPAGSIRRFACTSDREEYRELLLDVPTTSPWFMSPRPGLDASSRDCYELLSLTVDGRPQQIRRSARRSGQVYTVRLDSSATGRRPVRVRQTFRVVTPSWGHRVYVELPQPARGFSLIMDYTNTNIASMTVTDMVASSRPAQVAQTPEAATGREVHVDVSGWLLPQSGFAFTWTLDTELPHEESPRKAA